MKNPLDVEHTTSCGHTWTMRHTACPQCFGEMRAMLLDTLSVLEAPQASSSEAKRELARKMRAALRGGGE